MLRFVVPGLTVVAMLGLAACQQSPQQAARAPTDTGNMAYPAPVQPGNYSTTRTTGQSPGFDNGNMTPPQPLATGTISRTTTTTTSPAAGNGNMTPPGYGGGLPGKP